MILDTNSKNNRSQMVEVQDLVHVYPNGTLALEGVSLVISEHERLAIIGQNGSGKTTLVKHFNALLQPTRGTVLVRGVDTRKTRTAELAKIIGYVFQNPNHQLFCVTVLEELRFGLRNLGLPKAEIDQRVQETIEIFRLQPYLEVHPYSLSMGIRKLVAISSIFAMGPQMMILDEPTTGQDFVSQKILSQAISTIYDAGKSIIFVSHDMGFVAEQSDRVVVMSRAKIIMDSSPKELFINSNILKEADLRPPHITQLGQALVNHGIDPSVLTVPEMIAEVKRALV